MQESAQPSLGGRRYDAVLELRPVETRSEAPHASRLTLVPPVAVASRGLSVSLERTWGALSSSPFRPGELPGLQVVELLGEVHDLAVGRAQAAGIPLALWIRIGVEASEATNAAALRSGVPAGRLAGMLDRHAAMSDGSQVRTLAAVRLRSYAKHVSGGLAVDRHRADERVELFLPDTLAGRWETAAAAAGQVLDAWLGERVREAPTGCVAWEVAAARECHSLTEWVYAALLSGSASRSA
jgi:hypothetical protein